ncbi:MAG: hypothetical protein L6Q71_04560 [Planctomycetes bacterium]|nr:hypothetical protein [Planctomycetota bacterium]NUQ34708.1 hypothetical protein [Planctomycetaceae bacterium]
MSRPSWIGNTGKRWRTQERLPGLEPEREIRLRACKLAEKWSHAHPQAPLEAAWLQALPKVYERKDSKAAERFVEAHVGPVPAAQCLHVFRAQSVAAQLFRLCGEEKRAKNGLLSADKALRRAPAEQTPSFLGLAVHYENALRLLSPGEGTPAERKLRRRARTFFFKLLDRGYGCFESIVAREGQ